NIRIVVTLLIQFAPASSRNWEIKATIARPNVGTSIANKGVFMTHRLLLTLSLVAVAGFAGTTAPALAQDAQGIFERVDADGSGHIDQAEFDAYGEALAASGASSITGFG